MERKMLNFLMALIGMFFAFGLGILVMIFGWGLQPVSWGWIIGGGIGGTFLGALFQLFD
jgi:hypothetical protein